MAAFGTGDLPAAGGDRNLEYGLALSAYTENHIAAGLVWGWLRSRYLRGDQLGIACRAEDGLASVLPADLQDGFAIRAFKADHTFFVAP